MKRHLMLIEVIADTELTDEIFEKIEETIYEGDPYVKRFNVLGSKAVVYDCVEELADKLEIDYAKLVELLREHSDRKAVSKYFDNLV